MFTLLLGSSIANDWINKSNALDVGILGIVGLNEGIGNVWNVEATVALAGDVHLVSLDLKRIHEVLVEAQKLLRESDLVGDVGYTLRISHSYGLLDPEHVRQISPAVGVLCWRERAGLP